MFKSSAIYLVYHDELVYAEHYVLLATSCRFFSDTYKQMALLVFKTPYEMTGHAYSKGALSIGSAIY